MTSSSKQASIRFTWRYLPYLTLVVLYAIFMLALNGTCLISSLFPGRERRSGMVRKFMLFITRVLRVSIVKSGLGKITFEGFEDCPTGPAVIVANHTGLLDALLLLSKMPDLVIIFKQGLRRSPFYSHLTSEPGYIGNDEGLTLLREGTKMLEEGRSLIIFPEGTRTERVPVNPFHGGFAAVARRAQAPIQTVLIENPSWILGKGKGYFGLYQLPFTYRYRLGERFIPRSNEDSHELTSRVEAYFQKELSHLQEPPWRAS